MVPEVPPTAGLPLSWSDFFSGAAKSLEQKLAEFLAVDWVQVECSGTAALVVALTYLRTLSPRKSVVISGYTCPLVAIAIAQAGLQVKLCDSSPDSYDFDPQALAAACSQDTLCIIVTHFGGLPADLRPAKSIAKACGAWLIEDAAQSLGAKAAGVPVGTAGDIGVFSLSVGKGLTIYQGGFLVAADPAVQEGLRRTSRQLVRGDALLELVRICQLIGYRLVYNPCGMALAYGQPLARHLRRGDRAAAVGDVFPLSTELCSVSRYRRSVAAAAIERLADYHEQSRRRAQARLELLQKLPQARPLSSSPDATCTWPFITLLFQDERHCEMALTRLWTAGLGVTKLFVSALSDYDYLAPIVPAMPVPRAQSFATRTLTISNSHWLSDEQFATILHILEAVGSD